VSLQLAPAADQHRRYVERLLERNGLPTADLDSPAVRLYVAREGDRPVGCGGLQPLGDGVALLRSVAVERPARGRGVGAAVCEALETEAAAMGVGRLYLLTTSAAGFFAARGYEPVDRADVPDPVRETAQFAELCPDSATVMATRP
jgi:amino-acid N-acetyltransferase